MKTPLIMSAAAKTAPIMILIDFFSFFLCAMFVFLFSGRML
jgi:hypothetical protein